MVSSPIDRLISMTNPIVHAWGPFKPGQSPVWIGPTSEWISHVWKSKSQTKSSPLSLIQNRAWDFHLGRLLYDKRKKELIFFLFWFDYLPHMCIRPNQFDYPRLPVGYIQQNVLHLMTDSWMHNKVSIKKMVTNWSDGVKFRKQILLSAVCDMNWCLAKIFPRYKLMKTSVSFWNL